MCIFVAKMGKIKKNRLNYIFSIIYGGIISLRNFLFDIHLLKSKSFDIPIISIGNLAVGGTGKTPHTEFILQYLKKNYNIAVLSRGYKRKTKGFVIADSTSDASTIGDEPYQIFTSNPQITVAVDENRVRGVEKLMKINPRIDVILLDDAFQHRYVQAGLSILLTEYDNLYSEDYLMPYGRLREDKKNSKRADIVIVTKCHDEINNKEQELIKKELKIEENEQQLFYSIFNYGKIYPIFEQNEVITPELTESLNILLVTGIENPRPMYKYLNEKVGHIESLNFPDHHDFTQKDIRKIEQSFYQMTKNKVIITTEKDASRIKLITNLSKTIKENIYALPIEVEILHNKQEEFIIKINNYVEKNKRNG